MAYLRLAPYFVIALLALAVGWYKWSADVSEYERAKAVKELEIAQAVNAEQAKTIKAQQEWRDATDKIVRELTESVVNLAKEQQDKQSEITEASNADEQAKQWYAAVIPASMQRVLNAKANRSKQN